VRVGFSDYKLLIHAATDDPFLPYYQYPRYFGRSNGEPASLRNKTRSSDKRVICHLFRSRATRHVARLLSIALRHQAYSIFPDGRLLIILHPIFTLMEFSRPARKAHGRNALYRRPRPDWHFRCRGARIASTGRMQDRDNAGESSSVRRVRLHEILRYRSSRDSYSGIGITSVIECNRAINYPHNYAADTPLSLRISLSDNCTENCTSPELRLEYREERERVYDASILRACARFARQSIDIAITKFDVISIIITVNVETARRRRVKRS